MMPAPRRAGGTGGWPRPQSTSLPAMSEHPVVDVTIIGAGPAGLAAAYYAGHREASCRIIESLEQLGGQVAAVYPEKHIFDIAGFPKINGQEYVDRMVEQGLQYGAEALLGEAVETLERVAVDGEELWAITTDKGGPYLTRTIIITAGHGAFEPRTLPIEGLEEWRGRGLHYFVKRKADFAGKRCVIVGGGDSALDWTINLQDTATGPIRVVHRRDRFRGLESSQTAVRGLVEDGAAVLHTPCEVRALHGGDVLERVTIEDTASGEQRRRRLRRADPAARLRLAPRPDRELGPRGRRQEAGARRPDLVRDGASERLRGRRRRPLRRQDHADHDRPRRGGDRRQPVRGPGPRREAAARLLDGVGRPRELAPAGVARGQRVASLDALHEWVLTPIVHPIASIRAVRRGVTRSRCPYVPRAFGWVQGSGPRCGSCGRGRAYRQRR